MLIESEIHTHTHTHTLAQLTGAVQYTNCISAERYDTPNEYPGYDTKRSDSESPVLELWRI